MSKQNEETMTNANTVIDNIVKIVQYEEEYAERNSDMNEPYYMGYTDALVYIASVINSQKSEEKVMATNVTAALAETDDGFKPDVEIKRVRDLMCDLARLLLANPREDQLTADVSRGLHAASDLITALDGIDIDLFAMKNTARDEDESATDGNGRD